MKGRDIETEGGEQTPAKSLFRSLYPSVQRIPLRLVLWGCTSGLPRRLAMVRMRDMANVRTFSRLQKTFAGPFSAGLQPQPFVDQPEDTFLTLSLLLFACLAVKLHQDLMRTRIERINVDGFLQG